MTVAYAMRNHCRKLVKLASIFRRDFNSSKCKTWARMTTARIKLLRNRRETVVRQMRRDVALLLQSGQDATARIRVEHVIREQNMMAANEILELFCERLVTRLSIVAKQKDCPKDLKEAISSLIFAGPRCSDIPELSTIRDIFQKKYGKDFVAAATDLRPDSGVNRLLIEKLSALNPPGELKLKVMKEIAKEYQVEWDTSETESELLKPSEERIEGPQTFVSAGNMPLNPRGAPQSAEAENHKNRLSGGGGGNEMGNMNYQDAASAAKDHKIRLSGGGGNEMGNMNYQDAVSAAKAAADSAKDAVAAAQAAAQLVQTASYDKNTRSNLPCHPSSLEDDFRTQEREYRSQSLGGINNGHNTDLNLDDVDLNTRRHSHNVRRTHTDIKFDESDSDDDGNMNQQPPSGMYGKAGNAASVHPKLPDYDALSTRFEALKYLKT